VKFFLDMVDSQDLSIMGRLMRSLRLLRVVRTLRIVRLLRYIATFRKMVFAIAASLQTLFWSLLLLGLIMYMFAVCFTQGVSDHLKERRMVSEWTKVDEDLQMKFGSLGTAWLHLYQSISGGISWGEVAAPLADLHWTFLILFLMYISMTVFCVLNVVTSIFVESAMQTAAHHRDLLIQEKIQDKQTYAKHMKDVFNAIDTDGTLRISEEEMELFMEDEHLRLYLEALEINILDARVLFRLLDHDESGEIDIDEFCEGCLRLKGEAKSFDIHCLLFENQRMLLKTKHFMKYVEDRLDTLMDLMQPEGDE